MAQQSARPHIFREDDGGLLIEWVWLERRFGGMRYRGVERPMCIWCLLRQCEEMEIL